MMARAPLFTKSPAATGFWPLPARAIVCGDPAAESTTASEADSVPTMEGANDTEMVQLMPGTSDPPQLLVWIKSAAFGPVTEMLPIESGTPPGFERVTACAVEVVAIV